MFGLLASASFPSDNLSLIPCGLLGNIGVSLNFHSIQKEKISSQDGINILFILRFFPFTGQMRVFAAEQRHFVIYTDRLFHKTAVISMIFVKLGGATRLVRWSIP